MSPPSRNPEAEQKAIVSAIGDLLATHYHEAEEARDDKGKFSINFTASVKRGEQVKVKVRCRISKGTISDEIELDLDQPELPI